MGPTLLENKCMLLTFSTSLCLFFLMDLYVLLLIQQSTGPLPLSFNTSSEPCSAVSPFCSLDTKSLMLDWLNFYVYNPLSALLYRVGHFGTIFTFISANSISVSHVLVAAVGARLIAHDSLCIRRIGVLLFELRNFLDAFDGTVARERRKNNNINNNSSNGSSSLGYYIDGVCDGLGCIFLLIACSVYLRNHPIKKSALYSPLPTTIVSWTDQREKQQETSHGALCLGRVMFSIRNKVCRSSHLPIWIGFQWLFSSTGWNRYIYRFASILEHPSPSPRARYLQADFLRYPITCVTIMYWRLINVHAVVEVLLASVFFDRLADCLVLMHLFGWILLGFGLLMGELLLHNSRYYVL